MNTITETNAEKLAFIINQMDESDLMCLNNAYCESTNNPDAAIFSNDEEFFEMFFGGEGGAERAVRAAFYGDYNSSHDYVRFNGYGNLESFDYFDVDGLVEFPDTIAEYILDGNEADFDYIQAISEFVGELE